MQQHLEKLMFTVAMIDQVSDPVKGIEHHVNNLTDGFVQMGVGAAGVLAAGYTIKAALEPAIEMDRALGEVRSLGVVQEELDTLTAKSLEFSTAYGKSAEDFIKSSYDIQSAIGGLENGELAQFTNASNVLAAATKADAGTITNYMGTMFGIFQEDAQAMGKSDWVNNLAGQTARAVQMFKTTGMEMSGAFTSLGAEAQSAGISMTEQMAILGTLQATMSGSEAGTKYRAFLSKAGEAQEKLGLQFTDSQGRLLPMLDILGSLQERFGDTLEVSESVELKKAFGSNEAVGLIKLLMNQTDGLASSMNELGKVKGLEQAETMAQAMVDPWQQFEATIKGIRIIFGNALLPAINGVVGAFSEGLTWVIGWAQEFPLIAQVIGYTAFGVIALTGAVSAGIFMAGLFKTAWAALSVAWIVGKGAVLALGGAMSFLKGVFVVLNAAMWANPVMLIVGGVVALVAAVGSLIYFWDDLVEMFTNFDLVAWLGESFDWLIGMLNKIPGIDIEMGSKPDVAGARPSNLDAPKQLSVPAGGVGKQISNAVSNNSSKVVNQTIHTSQPLTPQFLENQISQSAP